MLNYQRVNHLSIDWRVKRLRVADPLARVEGQAIKVGLLMRCETWGEVDQPKYNLKGYKWDISADTGYKTSHWDI